MDLDRQDFGFSSSFWANFREYFIRPKPYDGSISWLHRLPHSYTYFLSLDVISTYLCLWTRSNFFCPSCAIRELLDTLFIVIHKKPLIFLHWYHHVTVLLYCWHSYVTKSPAGLFFVVMNYSVHASMYGYYFLMAMKLKPKWFNPIIITCFQISQMIVGVSFTWCNLHLFVLMNTIEFLLSFMRHQGTPWHIVYCYPQEAANFFALVSPRHCFAILLAFICHQITSGTFLCCHELLSSR